MTQQELIKEMNKYPEHIILRVFNESFNNCLSEEIDNYFNHYPKDLKGFVEDLKDFKD
jgi:hypothetical protein